ncbi:e3 ubiquitin- ligase complex slx8-rfp subunit slx8 protein [Rutstroemia sp. NJR-2017a WRK4]|nr:e3 ubiquitin- ligase complex slx8-rfp subunit slx8 protein [Rutstroemia sp. NJR-2017a WRK4]
MSSGYPFSYSGSTSKSNSNSTTTTITAPSPWNASAFANGGRESFTLPPINPDSRRDNSPSYHEPLPSLSCPSLFLPGTPISNSRQERPPPSLHRTSSNSNPTRRIINLQHRRSPSMVPPPDNSHLNFLDEDSEAQPPPPSNQQQAAQNHSQPSSRSATGESDDDLAGFDWDSYLRENDSTDPSAPPPTSRRSSIVDLTESSPPMPANKRKAETATSTRPPKISRTNSRTPKLVSAQLKPAEDVEVVDLAENDNLQEYEAAQAKRQEDLIKQQNQEEATKPLKLVEFQCIICMDNPTDLTVTHCVCRTTISTGTHGRKPPKNGLYPIAIKLMTANKKGKQPSRR